MSNKITRRGFLSVAAVAASPFLEALPATAARSDGIEVQVDVGGQRMEVYVEGRLRHRWTVSTGKNGHDTPGGTYRPQRLEREWYSTKYDDAPMPHAIFFHGGYAIHGTTATRQLGRAASHGCIRLAPGNAAQLFSLVQDYGPSRTRIIIDN
jgi:lipoprotein-anchoring transpeptidase ErfK/SrfK